LPDLLAKHPDIHYVIAGKYDTQELERLRELSVLYNVEKYVTFTGFVADTEVQDHYLLADIFVMPSKGEGFGIVFIEAMACGVPVLAGNQDGSVDALLKGKVGSLVNPDDKTAIVMAIQELFTTHLDYTKKVGLQQTILQHFGFRTFIERTQKVLHLLRQ
jgi:glycosyltransferase involved in cell wall biosynthesis